MHDHVESDNAKLDQILEILDQTYLNTNKTKPFNLYKTLYK